MQPPDQPGRAQQRPRSPRRDRVARATARARRPCGRRARPRVATSTTRAATARSSGHQRAPPKGRVCWPHPIGDSHAGQALVTREPGPVDGAEHVADAAEHERDGRGRRRRCPAAPRVVEDSWQVTAATPTHTSPTAATEAPVSSAPSTGCPVTAIAGAEHHGQDDVGGHGDQDGGGQAGVPPDHGRAEHLGAPELLVLAGVPDHRERAHQGGEHRQGDELAVQHVAARRWAPRSGPSRRMPALRRHHPGLAHEVLVQGQAVARTSPWSRPRTGPARPTTR